MLNTHTAALQRGLHVGCSTDACTRYCSMQQTSHLNLPVLLCVLCMLRVSVGGPAVQVGCAMNCQFCRTGRMGLSGNLSTAQIVEQVGGWVGAWLQGALLACLPQHEGAGAGVWVRIMSSNSACLSVLCAPLICAYPAQ